MKLKALKKFKKIILISKRRNDKNIAPVLIKLKNYLQKLNKIIYIEKQTAELFNLKLKPSEILSENQFKNQIDLIIVVGGDGSLLNASHNAVIYDIPILGINRGKLGFLTDISPDHLFLLKEILNGKYQTEKRFFLKAEIIRQQKIIHQCIALNDLVLLSGDTAHIIEFSIDIDKELMCTQRADGLIISTPTGSTAYALSGGGPILHPQLNAFVLVPMFPHKLTSRPIVISGNSEIQITISLHNETTPRLSRDGHIDLSLEPEDKIKITKFNQTLTLIHPDNYQYFSTLRSKLQWENKPY